MGCALSEHRPEIQSSLTATRHAAPGSPALKDRATVILPLRGKGGECHSLDRCHVRGPRRRSRGRSNWVGTTVRLSLTARRAAEPRGRLSQNLSHLLCDAMRAAETTGRLTRIT